LKIKRVYFVRLREWWHERKREKAGKKGVEWEKKVFEEFRQVREEQEQRERQG